MCYINLGYIVEKLRVVDGKIKFKIEGNGKYGHTVNWDMFHDEGWMLKEARDAIEERAAVTMVEWEERWEGMREWEREGWDSLTLRRTTKDGEIVAHGRRMGKKRMGTSGLGGSGKGEEGMIGEGEGSARQAESGGNKLQGWDFMLGDSAKKRRKPLKGRRRGRTKKTDQNRVMEMTEKQGFLASWSKAAKPKAASKED